MKFLFMQKREDLLKQLSCFEYGEDDTSPVTTTVWSSPTTSNDLDTSKSPATTEESTTINHDKKEITNLEMTTTPINIITSTPNFKNKIVFSNIDNLETVHLIKNNIKDINNNNLQSNDIPKIVKEDDLQLSENLNDQQLIQHKFLHEELARRGNFETIFTQPTDHFVPPLVMAKAKLSNDMTVITLEEKHAHLAEQQMQHNKLKNIETTTIKTTTNLATSSEEKTTFESTTDKILSTKFVHTTQLPILTNSYNKDSIIKPQKYGSPKKYTVKTYDYKIKPEKSSDLSFKKTNNKSSTISQNATTIKYIETTTAINLNVSNSKYEDIDDQSIDLKIIINDIPQENGTTFLQKSENDSTTTSSTTRIPSDVTENSSIPSTEQFKTTNILDEYHEVNKITIPKDNIQSGNSTVFEFTTKIPIVNYNVTENIANIATSTSLAPETISKESVNTSLTDTGINENNTKGIIYTQTSSFIETTSELVPSKSVSQSNGELKLTEIYSTKSALTTTDTTAPVVSTIYNITGNENTNNSTESINSIETAITHENYFNNTEYNNGENNTTDQTFIGDEYTPEIDDFQSPLLSGASEPLPKPNRSRRPQNPPNRNKFNPFRILG